ncbi:hypothetical protein [Bradyrhizobium commune]|uniref:HEPN AbiU2-like domain-containing protein n=1 Tax=Bradyrhizobium commune TaxID=83627 RepID=A0A7S9D5A1_9BRAD|nr:hypothetical protein [Bradyrhizobium commune]QPF91472.1 hypothetical protein IC761_34395 [Bradyrhizobium commune]
MSTDYPITVRSLGDKFERVRLKASELASRHRSMFWWKPGPDEWHLFVFANHNVAILFVGYLRAEIVGKNTERVRAAFVSADEVGNFADHCVYIRSVYEYARRLFAESTDAEREAMTTVAPHFFEDLASVFAEFAVLAVCRVTDPWIDGRNENFVVELFAKAFARIEPLNKQLSDLQDSMAKHRTRLEPARHKLTAHADRETINAGKPLGAAT